MAPDLNSLPASPSPTLLPTQLADRPRRISFNNINEGPPSPRSPTLSSLAAAATINAGLQRTAPSPGRTGVERRRSSLMNNLSLNDPTLPGPGEIQHRDGSSSSSRRGSTLLRMMSDPDRSVSLGELHQELENEQEAQVNRLLHMIRQQQDQLAAMARAEGVEAEPAAPLRPQTLSRQSSAAVSSHVASRGASPALNPMSASHSQTDDISIGSSRDECAFYQAETQNLTRENQMLKHRIRELERQIAELTGPSSQPAVQSPLAEA